MRLARSTPLPRQAEPNFSQDAGARWNVLWNILNAVASKPIPAMIGLLGFMTWILWTKLDRVQEAQMTYVLTDSKNLLKALENSTSAVQNSTNATEKTNRILERMESKQ